ncbi:hypothetical protein ACHAXT_000421 [Thalassiosira profunda]
MGDSAANRPGRNMESGSPVRKDVRKREMSYHYAGKVHVRGLLRRVWRPRYLALGDDGYLRYHESIPPLFQQDLQHNNPYSMSISNSSSSHEIYSLHNTHRPKTILAILDGTRTIDPYSVVDRHVALPQGVYGFVFRGRPVELHTTDSGRTERGGIASGHNHDAEQGALILPPENPSNDAFSPGSQSSKHSTKAAVVNLVFPKGTERRRTAQKIAKQAVNPDVLSCFGRTPNSFEGGLLSHNSSSSSLMGYEQPLIEEESANNQWGIDSHESMGSYQRVDSSQVCGDLSDDQPPQMERMQTSAQPKSTVQVQVQAASIQSREYLCAVSTAEEAESWVVALRWAAEHRRRIRYERAAPGRNETTTTASVPRGIVAGSEHLEINSKVGGSSVDGINPVDSALGPMSESKAGCDSESGDGSANKDFGGDSKESLTSLLIEQEGWCKTVLEENAEPLFPEEIDEQSTPKEEVAPSDEAESPSRSHPTIVVTKVCTFRPPENVSLGFAAGDQRPNDAISLLPFRWALPGSDLLLQYEIQLLLLRNCKRSENIVRPESVEEHNICKTLPEILDLIRDLIEEFDAGKNGLDGGSPPGRRLLERRSTPKRPKPASAQARVEEYSEESMHLVDDDHSTVADEGSESGDEAFIPEPSALSSPLPTFPDNRGISCWSKPDHRIFRVRSSTYLQDRVKLPSDPAVFHCRGVDVWITDNAERNIARHPSVLGGELHKEDTFVVNFLLPFANLVAYFTIPPIEQMPANVAEVWTRFIRGEQEYRDGKLKLLPVVVDGPWIVKKAVGPGTAPAMIGRDLPLQYYFSEPTATKKGVYEVDVLVMASRIARGILNVVKGHTKSLTIAFAFIIEASEEAHLPETVLCAFQVHCLHLEDCPNLPDCYPDG